MSEPLMAPPQLKPSPPLLHKEPPILIKQASLDKNKGGKKDKVWKDLHIFFLFPKGDPLHYIKYVMALLSRLLDNTTAKSKNFYCP
jgi:hypothetical protein